MCKKCEELQYKIDRYKQHAQPGMDSLTVERIGVLVKELEKQKDAVQH